MKNTLKLTICLTLAVSFIPLAEAVQHLKRPDKLETIRQSEPEVARYVDSLYEYLDENIEMLIQARTHWNKMKMAGELDEADYQMVYKRDYTDRLTQLKNSIPEFVKSARKTIEDIRTDQVTIISYNKGVHGPNSYNQQFEIKRNGELIKDGQTAKTLTTEEVNEIESLISAMPEPETVTPILGSSWTNLTIYQGGVFLTYDQSQPETKERTELTELILALSQ